MRSSLSDTHNGLELQAAKAFAAALKSAFPRHTEKLVARMLAEHGAEPHPNTIAGWLRGERMPSHEYWLLFVAEFGLPLVELVYSSALRTETTVESRMRGVDLAMTALKETLNEHRAPVGSAAP